MNTYAIVLGGGSGARMGAGMNKVLLPLRGVPAIVRAIAPFTGLCAGIVLVAREGEGDTMRQMLTRYGLNGAVLAVVPGGADRQASVAAGLNALPADAECVLVHDGARALVTVEIIRRAIESMEKYGSGVASVPVTDTVKRADRQGNVQETLDRDTLFAMQTPQAFRVTELRQAHAEAERDGFRGTDDAALLEHAGLPVHLCEGSRENIKLTTAIDLSLAEAILSAREEA